jgi:hypothetical protein
MICPIETFSTYMFKRSSPITYKPSNSKYTYSYHPNAFTFLYCEYIRNMQERKIQKEFIRKSKKAFILDF